MQRLTDADKTNVERYLPFVTRFAIKHFGDDDEIISAAQWAIICAAPGLVGATEPRKYIAAAVARECLRAKRRQLKYVQCDAAWWETQIEPVLPEILDDVRAAVDSLPWGRTIAEECLIRQVEREQSGELPLSLRQLAASLDMDKDTLIMKVSQLKSLIIDRLEKCA